MQFSWKNPLKALPVLLLLAAYAGAAFGVAGNVQFVIGDVKLTTRAGVTRALQKGAEINEGDRIVTAAEASAQIKMVDGGFIAIRPNTDMSFDTYRYSGKEDGTENAIVSLLQGGFRTITGIIGRTNKQNYLVKTVTATIGIRGTDHEPMVILAPRPGQVAIAAPGTYDKVNVGIAFIRNDAGSVDIHRNQVGFAPETKAPPVVLPRIPPFYKPTPAPGPQKAKQEAKDEGKKEAASSAAAPAEKAAEAPAQIRDTAVVDPASSVTAPPAVAAAPVAVAPVVAITATGASGTTLNTTTQTATTSSGTTAPITQTAPTTQTTAPPVLTPAVPIAGGTGTYRQQLIAPLTVGSTTYNSNYNLASGVLKNAQNYLFDASGNLVSILSSDYRLSDRGGSGPPSNTPNAAVPYTGTAGGLPSSPLTGATVVLAGGTTPDGNYNDKVNGIRMGRYVGGAIATVDASNTASPVAYVTQLGSNSLNWAVREIPVSIPLTGSFEYTPAYATKPTDSLGNVGTLNYASLSANFTTQTVNPAVGITINNQNLSSAATNVPIDSKFGFDVSSSSAQNTGGGTSAVQINCFGSNCAPAPVGGSGGYGGRFTGGLAGATAAGGAFFRYDFNTRYDPAVAAGATGGIPTGVTRPVNDYIQGLVAFTKGTAVAALPVPTATTGNQSISTTYFRSPPAGGSYYQSWSSNYNASPTSYTSSFGTGSPNTISESAMPNDPTPASETLTGATVAQAPTNATSFAATGISFGRYSGGTISGVDWQGTSFSGPNVGNYAWIKGPDVALLTSAMRGTAKYVLDGGTTPASATGPNLGTINSAVLAVNFNTSSVGVELSVTKPAPNVTFNATTTSSGVLSGNPATTLRLSDGGSFFGSTWNAAFPAHQSLYVTLNGGAVNAPGVGGQVNGQLTGYNLSGAGMTYSFQDMTGAAPGFGTNGAVAFALGSYTTDITNITTAGTSAIDPNNVPYMLGIGAVGLMANPTPGSANSPASIDPGRYLANIDGAAFATGRTNLGADGLPIAWDGRVPVSTAPVCSPPATCNPWVTDVPGRFSINPGSFVATGSTPLFGQVVLPAGKSIASVLESGFDAATGMRWGRYGAGVVAIFDRVGGGFAPKTWDVSNQNFHMILGPNQAGPTMLPLTGTYAYTNVGGTKPSDNLGSAAGTLNAATLVADFAAQTVNAGVNLTVSGQTWAAGGTAIPIHQRVFFEAGRGPSGGGNLNICTGAACGTTTLPTASTANTSGSIVGAFNGTSGQGLGMAYSLNQGGIAGTTVSGVTAFRR